MKVILRDNVESLGKAGEIIAVKDGYARNYLIPRNLAYPATRNNLRVWEDEKRRLIVRISKETQEAEAVKARLEEVSLVIPMLVGEEGRLFGSVTNRIISEALREKGFEIDHRLIVIDEPIRTQGDFEVSVRLVHGVVAAVKVTVIPQEAPEEEKPEATEPPVAPAESQPLSNTTQ